MVKWLHIFGVAGTKTDVGKFRFGLVGSSWVRLDEVGWILGEVDSIPRQGNFK